MFPKSYYFQVLPNWISCKVVTIKLEVKCFGKNITSQSSGEDLNEKCIKYNVLSAIINVYG